MSLFKKAGKKFEETKRTVMEAAESEYVCRSCEEPVAEDYEYCPHCGEATVEPIE
jgi:Zn finger protein HypA/HybF involved in hydrogenase expression